MSKEQSQLLDSSARGGCEERTWAREAEKSPLLDAVVREQLVKTQQAGKGLAIAVVNYELWRLTVAL
jgi:hypothetical protein